MQVWHEVSGDGDPLVLLHGGFASATSFSSGPPVLAAAGYRVYIPERRAHGHTRDVAGPITYSLMADDTIAYLETAVQAPAHLIGWSDGAVVALLVALRRLTQLVDRIVLIGQYYNFHRQDRDPLTTSASSSTMKPPSSFATRTTRSNPPTAPIIFPSCTRSPWSRSSHN